MNTVTLATFHELEPAQQLRERLQQAGLPATIYNESRLQRFGFMSEPLAAVHVEIPRSRYLEARRLVEEWEHTGDALCEAVRCPECHSSRVEFPQLTRKFVTTALVGLLMVLRIIPREFYCLDCHFTWPKSAPLQRELDILGFPVDARFGHPRSRRARPGA